MTMRGDIIIAHVEKIPHGAWFDSNDIMYDPYIVATAFDRLPTADSRRNYLNRAMRECVRLGLVECYPTAKGKAHRYKRCRYGYQS